LLRRKIREPILREQIVKYGWRGLTYGDLDAFLAKHKKKKPKFTALRILMFKLPDFKREVQESIKRFL
jgi:uncharacterized membrane protein YsdA (DUF1294 family)